MKNVNNFKHGAWDSVAGAYNSLLELECEVIPGSYAHREIKRIENLLLRGMYESGDFGNDIVHVGCGQYVVAE
jgi:hypothetical protein